MAYVVEINSLSDTGASVYRDLKGAGVKGGQNPLAGLFIAESPNVIEAALAAGYEPVSLLAERRRLAAALSCADGYDVPVYTAEDSLLASLTGFKLTRGILCCMRRRPRSSCCEVIKGAKKAAVLMGIVDPTNVGAIFRSAAALGADAVLLDPTCCDPLHRRAARVSMGAVFRVPWARLGGNGDGKPNACSLPGLLKSEGFTVLALALKQGALPVTAPELARCDKLALVLGSEGAGLEESVIAECDHTVIIPMANGMDSLNVGAAAAVAFHRLFAEQKQQ